MWMIVDWAPHGEGDDGVVRDPLAPQQRTQPANRRVHRRDVPEVIHLVLAEAAARAVALVQLPPLREGCVGHVDCVKPQHGQERLRLRRCRQRREERLERVHLEIRILNARGRLRHQTERQTQQQCVARTWPTVE